MINQQYRYQRYLAKKSNKFTLSGVDIDNQLTFHSHVNNLCRKAENQIYALKRLSVYVQKKIAPYNVGSVRRRLFSIAEATVLWGITSVMRRDSISTAEAVQYPAVLNSLRSTEQTPQYISYVIRGENDPNAISYTVKFQVMLPCLALLW